MDLSKFLQNAMEGEKDDNNRELVSEPIDLEAFNQEEDYNPADRISSNVFRRKCKYNKAII